MAISAESAANALLESWRLLATAMPEGWSRESEGAVGTVTGVRGPAFNGVWVQRIDAEPALIADLLDAVGAAGFGFCLQFRPNADARIAGLAAARGMIADDDVPLMVFEGPSGPDEPAVDPGLLIRQLEPEEGHLAARTASEAFEAPIEPFLAMATPRVLRFPGVRCYLGAVDGEPVTTGVGVTFGDSVGVFNVATPPRHRRHGYGAAVTRRAVADGLAAGAKWAWLQSTPDGYPVYERLGFRTVESWHCWVGAE
jgi:GNAT superfamily N-acetyltransferase